MVHHFEPKERMVGDPNNALCLCVDIMMMKSWKNLAILKTWSKIGWIWIKCHSFYGNDDSDGKGRKLMTNIC